MTGHIPPHMHAHSHEHAHGDAAIPGFDLSRQYAQIQSELEPAVLSVLRSTKYIMGERAKELEQRLQHKLGVKHIIACANGSDALVLALQAIGVGHGDEVIVPAFSFFATAGCVVRLGATPVFVDVDARTGNLQADLLSSAITPQTKAIMPVHLFGQMADMDAITAIAGEYGIPVIADGAQAIGARYAGKTPEAWSRIVTYSCFPTKNLGAAGDAGFIGTDDDALATRMRMLRVHGAPRQYHHEFVGMNSRMDDIQAAVLQVKLDHLDAWQARRAAIAVAYSAGLRGVHGIVLPHTDARATHVWHQYTIRALDGKRDALKEFLASHGIGSMVYYPTPLNRQPCFAELDVADTCPVSLQLTHEVLSLPIFPELTDAEVARIIATIKQFFAR